MHTFRAWSSAYINLCVLRPEFTHILFVFVHVSVCVCACVCPLCVCVCVYMCVCVCTCVCVCFIMCFYSVLLSMFCIYVCL